MAYIAPEILRTVALALGLYSDISIPGTPLLWMCVGAIFPFDFMRLIGAIGISTATGLWFAPCFTMVCWLVLSLFAVVFVALYDRLLYGSGGYADISLACSEELYTPMAEAITVWRPKL